MQRQKKKVLFVIDTLQVGGAEQSLLENTVRFKKITPVICHLYPGEALKSRFTESGIKVYSAGVNRKYGFSQAYKKLKEIIAGEQPDAIVAYLTRSEIVSRVAGKFSRVPVVGTFVSNLYSKEYNRPLSFTAKKAVSFFKLVNRITGRSCAGFIANSEAVRLSNATELGVPLSKIKVINRGRDSKVFSFQQPDILQKKNLRFLNIGRLVPMKSQDILIKGFKLFLEKYADATLDIIGEGPCRNALENIIKENSLQGKVILHGARYDIPSMIHDYDCFVFSSLSEGFSGSVVEAMFAGLPVLVSDIEPNLEAVHHLKTGYVFNKNSAEAVADALLWFVNNRDKALDFAAEGNISAKQHYELDKIAGELESYLEEIINNPI